MKPISLKLRGAIGIHSGLKQDELEIDLSRFSPGLIAIIGDNGSGKSTTMGNLTPYRCLAGKEGSLANQFYLKDSYRDFRFEMAGHVYRSYIVIDGRTGKQEAYLYEDGRPMNDGKTGTYDAAIEKLMGTEEIFFRSVFATQKAKSITSLTAGKRKELFMELLGFQRYELYAQHCKLQADDIETRIATDRGRLEQINQSLAKRPIVISELDQINRNLGTIDEEMRKLQELISKATAELCKSDRLLLEDKQKAVQVHDLGNEIGVLDAKKWKLNKDFEAEGLKLKDRRVEIEQEIARKQQIVEHKHEIEQSVIRLQTLRLQIKDLEERKAQLVEVEKEESKAEQDYRDEVYRYNQAVAGLANEDKALEVEKRNLLSRFDIDTQAAERELIEARRAAGLVSEVPCNTVPGLPEQCKLLSAAIVARDRIGDLSNRVVELKDDTYRWNNGLAALESRLKAIHHAMSDLIPPTNYVGDQFAERKRSIGFDPAQYTTVKMEIQTLEAKKWESLLEELRLAEASIEDRQKSLAELESRLIEVSDKHHSEVFNLDLEVTEKRVKLEGIKASLLPEKFHTEYLTLKTDLGHAQNQLKVTTDQRSHIMGDIQFRREMLKQLDQSAIDGETIQNGLKVSLSNLENWRLLQRACSKDGIPALELDAAGPAVSQIANELLASTFGTRFQIAFETTRQSKDGKKQIEDFDIWVYGDEGRKRIEDLSGGEEVWIEASIRQAIASYMRKQTGRDLACRFLDEADGPLSSAKAQNYLDMIRISHERESYHFTFIVSHRQELVAQVQQQIRFLPEEHKLDFVY